MGRLEKIVVLTVLFLVAVILAYSLNSGPGGNKAPLAGAGKTSGPRGRNGNTESVEQNASTANPAAAQPNGALNSSVAPAKPTGANTDAGTAAHGPAAANPPGAQPLAATQYIVTREGLVPTADDAWMLYTWKAGDTFAALSERYYGSKLYVSRLKSANEGKDDAKLAAGEQILVSVAPMNAVDPAALAKPAAKEADKTAEATATKWSGGPYVVKAGDVLGTISQQVYGTSKKWKKIYDANRDVLGDSPNTLKVGTKLRIPE
jgi:nucleoid-associated protein YgaU